MAEILVKVTNNSHPDPDVDRLTWKRGYVVYIGEDGHEWGTQETLPNFVKVKIPGVAKDTIVELIAAQVEDDDGNPVYEDDGVTPILWRPRRWKAAVDSMPASIRNELLSTGEITVTPNQVRNYIRRVRDDFVFGGL